MQIQVRLEYLPPLIWALLRKVHVFFFIYVNRYRKSEDQLASVY